MKDFEAEELAKIEIIRKKFIDTAKIFGFKLMDPSPIESLSTLEAKSGPAIREEIYFFKDKGERDVALRFDFTVGLTRFVASQKSLKLPAKFGSFGGVFRYDEPQKGRYRFFHQWNVEIFGKPSLESESEIIEFTSRLFDSLSIKNIQLQLNHRKIVESFIKNNYPYFDPKQQEQIFGDCFRLVDKVAKKSKEELLKEYEQMPSEFAAKLLDFAAIKGTPDEIEHKIDVNQLESWDYLKELSNSLKNRQVENFQINFGIVRGLDYYSGMVFEVFDTESKLGALAGGGRYDSLTKAFGRDDIGATGVAGGVERMILTMDEQKITALPSQSKVSVLYINEEMQKLAMNLASNLRSKDIVTEIDLVGKPLKKQMEAASDSKFAIIVAPKEITENKVIIRNMSDGTETKVLLDDLKSDPASILV